MISRRSLLGFCALSALGAAAPGSATPRPPAAASQAPAEPCGADGAPGRRPRWAMVVDLARCREEAGCTDCVAACHRVHNVPDVEAPRHRVRWIGQEPFSRVFPGEAEWREQAFRDLPVPVLCNHCDNPPCVRVCPTGATWKREDGIVMMDYHRCIGCRYCMAACPYGARSFNWVDPRPRVRQVARDYPTRSRGVVEKCNFCEERLGQGGHPACAEACRDSALTFGDLNDPASPVRRVLRTRHAVRRKPELGTGPSIYYLV